MAKIYVQEENIYFEVRTKKISLLTIMTNIELLEKRVDNQSEIIYNLLDRLLILETQLKDK